MASQFYGKLDSIDAQRRRVRVPTAMREQPRNESSMTPSVSKSAEDAAQTTANAALTSGQGAQTTADGKNTVGYGATPPVTPAPKLNDLWFNGDTTTNCPDNNCTGHTLSGQTPQVGAFPHRQLNWVHRYDGAAWKDAVGVKSIVTGDLVDLAIATSKLADASVLLAKLAPLSVDTTKLVDASVVTSKLADASVLLAKLAPLSVDTSKLVDGAVQASKILDGSVIASKVGFASGGGGNIAPNSAFSADVNADGLADSWNVYNDWSGTEPCTTSLVTDGPVIGAGGQRIAWSINSGTHKGIYTQSLKPPPLDATWYTVSMWIRASGTNIGRGMNIPIFNANPTTVLTIQSPTLASYWQKYIWRIIWDPTVGTLWAPTTVVPAYATRRTAGPPARTFFTSAGGTTGATAPTGVPGQAGIVDGSVTWFCAPLNEIYFSMDYASGTQGTLDFALMQIEPGEVATGWSPRVDELLAGSVTSTTIVDGAITTAKLAAGSVITAKLAAGAVTANELAAGSVTTAKLAAGAVTANELAALAVIAGKIAAGAVTATELAAGAVIAGKVAAGVITATELAAGAVTTAKLAAGAVTANELAALSVIAGKIAAGAVTATELAAGAVITAKLAAGAVTSNELAAGAVIAGKIAAGVITATELAAGAVTTAKLAAGAVDAAAISAGAVTAIKIAANALATSDFAEAFDAAAKLAKVTGGVELVASANFAAWAASTSYAQGDVRKNGNNLYVCTVAGTSAASGGPTGTDFYNEVTDGTAKWKYYPQLRVGPGGAQVGSYLLNEVVLVSLSALARSGTSVSDVVWFRGNDDATVNGGAPVLVDPVWTRGATYAVGDRRIGCPYTVGTYPITDYGITWAGGTGVPGTPLDSVGMHVYECTTAGAGLTTAQATAAAWSAGTTYALNANVTTSGHAFQSLQAGNLGNAPIPGSDTAFWKWLGAVEGPGGGRSGYSGANVGKHTSPTADSLVDGAAKWKWVGWMPAAWLRDVFPWTRSTTYAQGNLALGDPVEQTKAASYAPAHPGGQGVALYVNDDAYASPLSTVIAQPGAKNIYRCTTGGASAATGYGPTGTGASIADNAATWAYVRENTGTEERLQPWGTREGWVANIALGHFIWHAFLQPKTNKDNLDSMRHIEVEHYTDDTVGGLNVSYDPASYGLPHTTVPVADRLYRNLTSPNTRQNRTGTGWVTIGGQYYNATVPNGVTRQFLRIRVHNAFGFSVRDYQAAGNFTPTPFFGGSTFLSATPPSGGGGGGGGGGCPAPEVRVLMADGSYKPASLLSVGDRIWTVPGGPSEYVEPGVYEITEVELISSSERVSVVVDGQRLVYSPRHPVMTPSGWLSVRHLRPGDKILTLRGERSVESIALEPSGPVVRIATSASTYVTEGGVLNHNLKPQ